MGRVVHHLLQMGRPPGWIEIDLHLRHLEVERALAEAAGADFRREIPGAVEMLGQARFVARTLQQRKRLLVGQALRAADDRAPEARATHPRLGVEFDEGGERQAIHLRLQRADAVAEPLRQHRDDAIGEIHAVAAPLRLAIERRAGRDVMRNVRDVHVQAPAAPGDRLHLDGVVEILRVVRIDREHRPRPQILATRPRRRRHGLGDGLRLGLHLAGKLQRQVVLADDRKHVDPRAVGRPERFDDDAFQRMIPRSPRLDAHHHLPAGQGLRPRGLRILHAHVNALREARVVGNDLVHMALGLERADEGVAESLDDLDDAGLGALAASAGRPAARGPAHHAHQHAVAREGRAGLLRRHK